MAVREQVDAKNNSYCIHLQGLVDFNSFIDIVNVDNLAPTIVDQVQEGMGTTDVVQEMKEWGRGGGGGVHKLLYHWYWTL